MTKKYSAVDKQQKQYQPSTHGYLYNTYDHRHKSLLYPSAAVAAQIEKSLKLNTFSPK